MGQKVMIARLRALDGREEDARALLHAAQRGSHEEPGCRLYALHVDEDDPQAFVMIEIWEDGAAFDAHMSSPHVQELIARAEGVFTGPPEIQTLTALPHGHARKGAVTGA
jgi:quinol monooxygenase YgiN